MARGKQAAMSAEDEVNPAAATLSGDLRSAILDRIRNLRTTWQQMPASEQRGMAAEVNAFAEALVRRAVALVAAEGHPVVKVTVGEVKHNKNGQIEAKISFSKHDELRHVVFDATGNPALLIVTDVEQFIGERGPERIDPDQPTLLPEGGVLN